MGKFFGATWFIFIVAVLLGITSAADPDQSPQSDQELRDQLGTLSLLMCRSNEKSADCEYERQLAEVIRQLLSSQDAETRQEVLEQGMADHEATVRKAVVSVLGQVDLDKGMVASWLREAIHDPSPDVRAEAVRVLAQTHPTAIREVAQMLDDAESSVVLAAVSTLGRLGPAASATVPRLLELTDDPDPKMRDAALAAGTKIGWPPELALHLMLRALEQGSEPTRQVAARKLQAVGPELKPLIPTLIELLGSEQPAVRAAAAEVLGSCGPDAAAIPHLIGMIEACTIISEKQELPFGDLDYHDPQPCGARVRCAVVHSLGTLSAMAEERFQSQSESSADEPGARLGAPVRGAVEILVKLLAETSWFVRRCAIDALGQMLPVRKEAATALVKALADDGLGGISLEAGAVLRERGRQVPWLADSLALALASDQTGGRALVVEVLASMGAAAAPARAQLIVALQDEVPLVRRLAAEALDALGACSADEQQALTARLDDKEQRVRLAATEVLRHCPCASGQVIDALCKAADDPTWEVRAASLRTLQGNAAEAVAGICAAALKDPVVQVRRRAAECLASAANLASHREALTAATLDEDPTVRLYVARGLGTIGDDRARKALRTLANDEARGVRLQAARYLGESEDGP